MTLQDLYLTAEKQAAPFDPEATPVVNSSGFLSKATDTALDLAGLFVASKIVPGATYPTGQASPAAVAQKEQTAAQVQASAGPDYKKLALYGGIGLAAVVVLALLVRKS
jgi:hypothetical protein